jgi:hypothetical protein
MQYAEAAEERLTVNIRKNSGQEQYVFFMLGNEPVQLLPGEYFGWELENTGELSYSVSVNDVEANMRNGVVVKAPVDTVVKVYYISLDANSSAGAKLLGNFMTHSDVYNFTIYSL